MSIDERVERPMFYLIQDLGMELWVLHGKPNPLHDPNVCFTCSLLGQTLVEQGRLNEALKNSDTPK